MQQEAMEKRGFPRIPVTLTAHCRIGNRYVKDAVADLSEGGLYLKTREPAREGTPVRVALALPFAYLQDRMGAVSVKVFAGIMLGITFHMLNGLFSNLGIINSWPAFFSAITPSALFLLAATGMLWWVERR